MLCKTDTTKQITVFYDGSCSFCSTCVNLIKRFDRRKHININTLQSAELALLFKKLSSIPPADTVLLLYNKKLYEKSDAILKIISLIGFPLNTLSIFYIVPRKYRDKLYDIIAKNRYLFAGKNNTCAIQSQDRDS